jgi:shikimate dehydrogenase
MNRKTSAFLSESAVFSRSALAHYAVIGHPVSHSQSPFIHTRFAAQTRQPLRYTKLLASRDNFDACVRNFIAQGGCGLNITLPFKPDAVKLADTLSARALAAGAVNLLRIDADGEVYGDNTDGAGLVQDIEANLGVTLRDRRILLLGAGGAARGVILPLIMAGAVELAIVNRTAERATLLADHFAAAAASAGCRLTGGGGGGESASGAFDIVINATSASLANTLPAFDPAALTKNTLAYDMMYGAQASIFINYARQYQARVADGLGMLVEQAAEAFFIFRGNRPESASVLAALRAKL